MAKIKYCLCASKTYAYFTEIYNGICEEHGEEVSDEQYFDDLMEALKELSKNISYILTNYTELNKVQVTEHWLEKQIYNDDNDFLTSNVIAYADGLEASFKNHLDELMKLNGIEKKDLWYFLEIRNSNEKRWIKEK